MAYTPADYLELNRASWDELTGYHLVSPHYKADVFRRGRNILDPMVREGIGDVAGKRLLHLQCHFGLDTLCLARMGAEVTGLDFSPAAIAAARALATETGIAARFVEANVLDVPRDLTGFDIVFASWGALPWIPDMKAWMRVAARTLEPHGSLYLAEFHPVLQMLNENAPEDAPFTIFYPYDESQGIVVTGECDYASDNKLRAHTNVQFYHGLAGILNAAIEAGFTIKRFEELDRVPYKAVPQLTAVDEECWAVPPGAPRIPLGFVLRAMIGP